MKLEALAAHRAEIDAIAADPVAPSFDNSAKLKLTYGNYNDVQARGYLTGAISDSLAGKISISTNHRDAFIDNTTIGGKTDGTDEYDFRGQLLWNVAPDGRMDTTWKIRSGALWHDGTPITAQDIEFTAMLSNDPVMPWPVDPIYRYVDSVEAVDDRGSAGGLLPTDAELLVRALDDQ